MRKRLNLILAIAVFLSVGAGLYSNIMEQKALDKSKLPQKVVEERMFQRWLTNLKNKGVAMEAQDFKLKEENEIYNTTWMTVKSVDDPTEKALYDKTLEENTGIPKVVFNPNGRVFVDFRNTDRGSILSNQVRLYGLKEDKIIDARVFDCSLRANCYFDRGYFLDNDVFVVTEFSRNIDKKDQTAPICLSTDTCTYTIKLHLVDLVHNKRDVYESKPFDVILSDLIPEL